jgi:hypothetical protein
MDKNERKEIKTGQLKKKENNESRKTRKIKGRIRGMVQNNRRERKGEDE